MHYRTVQSLEYRQDCFTEPFNAVQLEAERIVRGYHRSVWYVKVGANQLTRCCQISSPSCRLWLQLLDAKLDVWRRPRFLRHQWRWRLLLRYWRNRWEVIVPETIGRPKSCGLWLQGWRKSGLLWLKAWLESRRLYLQVTRLVSSLLWLELVEPILLQLWLLVGESCSLRDERRRKARINTALLESSKACRLRLNTKSWIGEGTTGGISIEEWLLDLLKLLLRVARGLRQEAILYVPGLLRPEILLHPLCSQLVQTLSWWSWMGIVGHSGQLRLQWLQSKLIVLRVLWC